MYVRWAMRSEKVTVKRQSGADQELLLIQPRRSGLRRDFFLAMQTGFTELARFNLTTHQYRIVIYLLSKMEYNNIFRGSQASIANALGMKQPHVSKAIKELASKGIVFKEKDDTGRYVRVNAVIAWKGDTVGHEFRDRFDQDAGMLLTDPP